MMGRLGAESRCVEVRSLGYDAARALAEGRLGDLDRFAEQIETQGRELREWVKRATA